MQLPWNLHIGPVVVPSHLLFELLAYFIGFRYYLALRRNKGDIIGEHNRMWILVGAAAGALLGSRILGSLEHFDLLLAGNTAILLSAKTIVGGLLGGLIGVEIIKKLIGESHSSGDLFTLPLIVAILIGRIGCFLSGVNDATHGLTTSLPWGMDLGDGISRHPTALYEIVFLALLWFVLRRLHQSASLPSGALFQYFMTAYLFWRLAIDFLKPGPIVIWGVTAIQLACIAGLVYYGKVLLLDRGGSSC